MVSGVWGFPITPHCSMVSDRVWASSRRAENASASPRRPCTTAIWLSKGPSSSATCRLRSSHRALKVAAFSANWTRRASLVSSVASDA